MTTAQGVDFFKSNPIKEFVGAGFEKYRPHWEWKRNLSNASFYYIADGTLEFEYDTFSFTAKSGGGIYKHKLLQNHHHRTALQGNRLFLCTSETAVYKKLRRVAAKLHS